MLVCTVINFSGESPEINSGTILIGEDNGGYLRKVVEVETSTSEIVLKTEQASLEDVFESGSIEFSIDLTEADLGKNGNEDFTYTLLEEEYDGTVSTSDNTNFKFNTNLRDEVKLTGGYTFEPKFNFKFDFSLLNGLEEFEFSLNQSKVNLEAELEFKSSSSFSGTIQKKLGSYTSRVRFLVGGVPVLMDIEVDLLAEGHVAFGQSASIPVTFNSRNILNYGFNYKDGETNFINDFTSNNSLTSNPTLEGEASARIDIIPQVNFKFYKVVSNIIKPKPYIAMKAQGIIDSNGNNEVCGQVDVGVDLALSMKGEIFGKEIFNLSEDFQLAQETLWKSDDDCEISELIISNPAYDLTSGCGSFWDTSHDYSVHFIDDANTLGPGSFVTFLWEFNTGESGQFSVSWDNITIVNDRLKFLVCTNWGQSDFLTQSVFLTNSEGDRSNLVTFIRYRDVPKNSQTTQGSDIAKLTSGI